MCKKPVALLLISAAFSLFEGTAYGESGIHKYVDKNGRVTYEGRGTPEAPEVVAKRLREAKQRTEQEESDAAFEQFAALHPVHAAPLRVERERIKAIKQGY